MTPAAGRNVLFVVLDTVRKDHLGCYGYDRPTTPVLDEFATEARVYEEAVAQAPWTLPVHASLFTGQYPTTHGATQETPYLEGATTLAASLSAAGYDTACFSSNAWITPYTGLTAGFDAQDNFFRAMPGGALSRSIARGWRVLVDHDRLRGVADRLVQIGNAFHERLAAGGSEDSKTPAAVDSTIDFVEGADGPFFAFLNLMDAHLPYHPPSAYADTFAPGVDPTAVCQNAKAYNSGARAIDDEEWTAIRGLYDAELRHMDAELGRLFDWLRSTGRWADTTVIVCADHGELHGEHGLYGHEFNVYDPVVTVPLLVKHPDLDPGRDATTQVELLDLYHTVLDATGVAAAGEPLVPARSLLAPEYRRGGDASRPVSAPGEWAFVEYARPVVELNQLESKARAAGIDIDERSRFHSRMRVARRPDGKYVRNERIPDEAYRLDRDPDEADNLAGEGDAVLAAAETALSHFERELGTAWGGSADRDVLGKMGADATDRLRDLGYVE